LLTALAGWPLPRGLPTPSEVRHALDSGWSPDGMFVLKTVAVVAWIAWAQVAFCIVAELVAVARGQHRSRSMPLAGWAQPLAARLVGGLLLLQTVGMHAEAAALPTLPAAQLRSAVA